ncbi:hypothetical protein OK349_04680 [Sphingomonas sp. BT-65]|uniref:hypothetical protein n=1 Tax=Sphingomonas sp. BT-65 TaxID=2989821 RepID=UPI002235833A|nr:hypothetical protein [Sphingomonas sp. BT-65]MCW4460992.1 hypothetical protein [Sphingomonas sp. BT-65]
MINKAFTAAMALSMTAPMILAAPAASAQDVYDTEVLSKHADLERQRNLRRTTTGRNQPWGWNGNRQAASRSNSQAICANNRSMIQQGASSAKVRQLRALCARAGL